MILRLKNSSNLEVTYVDNLVHNFSYFLISSGIALDFTKRLGVILSCPLESHLVPNVEILRQAGVPDSNIVHLLQDQPRALKVHSEKFRKVVDEVKQRNICSSKFKFIHAVVVLRSMEKSTWNLKVAAYKKWGWSDDDVILAFQRNPYCLKISVDKITRTMNFMVNEMGFDSSILLKNPIMLVYSLEKRVKPRCRVYKVLMENGLIDKGSSLTAIFSVTEDRFLKKFVHQYRSQSPGLLQLYHENMAVSKS